MQLSILKMFLIFNQLAFLSTIKGALPNIYYDAVIACIRGAESILIFGPGEAKGELKKRLDKNRLGGRIAGVETVARMTDRLDCGESSTILSTIAFGNRIEMEPPNPWLTPIP